MNIAAHINLPGSVNPNENYNYRNLIFLATLYPDHRFLFIFDKPFDFKIDVQKNIKCIYAGPGIKNNLLLYYWYNFKLPGLLRKNNVDLFIGDGALCSLHSRIPQLICLTDLSFLRKNTYADDLKSRYTSRHIRKFLAKASTITVPSPYVQKQLRSSFPFTETKLRLLPFSYTNDSENPADADIQALKFQYSEGKEYFLAFVTPTSKDFTTVILKAFSLFKKRQLSNMQLLLAVTTNEESIVKDLATYKYRGDVKIISCKDSQLLNALATAAYAALYFPKNEILEKHAFIAIKNGVPLITTDNEFSKSLYGEAALYAAADEKSIAAKMMLVYKDENLQPILRHNAIILAEKNSLERTAAALWNVITETAAKLPNFGNHK